MRALLCLAALLATSLLAATTVAQSVTAPVLTAALSGPGPALEPGTAGDLPGTLSRVCPNMASHFSQVTVVTTIVANGINVSVDPIVLPEQVCATQPTEKVTFHLTVTTPTPGPANATVRQFQVTFSAAGTPPAEPASNSVTLPIQVVLKPAAQVATDGASVEPSPGVGTLSVLALIAVGAAAMRRCDP